MDRRGCDVEGVVRRKRCSSVRDKIINRLPVEEPPINNEGKVKYKL
jgi:hypothetical protein